MESTKPHCFFACISFSLMVSKFMASATPSRILECIQNQFFAEQSVMKYFASVSK